MLKQAIAILAISTAALVAAATAENTTVAQKTEGSVVAVPVDAKKAETEVVAAPADAKKTEAEVVAGAKEEKTEEKK